MSQVTASSPQASTSTDVANQGPLGKLSGLIGGSPAWPMAITRMVFGALWLISLRWKLPPNFEGSGDTRGLEDWLNEIVANPAFGFYGDFVDSVVLPNITLFGWLLFLTELFVGAALLFGVAIRPAALIGFGLSFNLWLAVQDVPGEWHWTYVLMAAFHAAIFVSPKAATWAIAPEAGWSAKSGIPVKRPEDLSATILRVTLGVVTLATWWSNIQGDFYDGDNFVGFFDWVFTSFPDGNGSSLGSVVRPILDVTILSNAEIFGWILTFVELGIGVGLVLGLFTRAASLTAVAFFGNLFLVYFGGHEWIFIYVMLTGAAALSFINWGGRVAGADQVIAKAKGESPGTLIW